MYSCRQSVAKNLVLGHRGSTSVIPGWLDGSLQLLLARHLLRSRCEFEICNCPVNTVDDGADRSGGPVWHAVSKLHVLTVLPKLRFTSLLQIKKQF